MAWKKRHKLAFNALLATVFTGCASAGNTGDISLASYLGMAPETVDTPINEFAHVMPPDAHPDISDEIELLSDNIIKDQKTETYAGDNEEPAEDELMLHEILGCQTYSSMTSIIDMEMSYEQAEENAREQLRRSISTRISGQSPEYPDYDTRTEAVCKDLLSLDILANGGFMGEEQELRDAFQETVTTADEYLAWERERVSVAVNSIIAHPELRGIISAWKRQIDYASEADALEQYEIRQTALQIISDKIHMAFGLPGVPVYIAVLPEELPVAGYSEPNKDYILINYNARLIDHETDHPVTDSFRESLVTLVEEIKHSIDSKYFDAYREGRIPAHSVVAEHVAYYAANSVNYAFLLAPEPGINVLYYKDRLDAYEHQYIERSAKDFQQRFSQQLERSMPMISNPLVAVAPRAPGN